MQTVHLPYGPSRAGAIAPRHAVRVRRRDLDGLRALAVLLVAVYHVWFHRVSGGVDVFLMLSGFFVGGSLLRAFLEGAPVRMGPLLRRLARRLAPALLLVVSVVLVASVALLPASQWAESARQSVASALYVENWYLAVSNSQYGAADASASPLQHIWSLSVQGQIFIALPVLLLLLWAVVRRRDARTRRVVLGAVLVAATVASFVYASVGVHTHQAFAYYDTFARAWEFLLGALLAGAVVWMRPGAAMARWLGWGGLALILVTGILVDGAAEFPGPAALVPLAGAAMLIIAGTSPGSVPSRVLASRPVAAAGAYAYAFYLWHWPVLVFVIALRDGSGTGWLAGTAVLVLSAGLAFLTKRFIEDPVRRDGAAPRGSRSARVRTAAVAVVMVGVIALPTAWLVKVDSDRAAVLADAMSGQLSDHPGAMAGAYPELFTATGADLIPSLAVIGDDKPRAVFDDCGSLSTVAIVCSYGDLDAERVIAMVGGSHTEQWIDALALVGEEEGFRVDVMIKWTCELVDGLDGVEYFEDQNPECEPWARNALDRLIEDPPDVVFTTASRPADSEDAREFVPGAYESAWNRLADAGIATVAIRDTPWTGSDTIGCISQNEGNTASCRVRASDVLDEVGPEPPGTPQFGSLVRFIDLNDVICPDGWCPFVQGGPIVYRDSHHLANTYAISAAPILRDRLLAVLDW